MCTAVTFHTDDHYFGRNLDLEYHYQESVVVMPRKFPFPFRTIPALNEHYSIIGMATIADGYPLFYDATNEYGLSVCGLNFPGNACYYSESKEKCNIAPFEFIPWVLGQCRTTDEAAELLLHTNLVKIPFSDKFPLSPLHWLIADQNHCITVEPMADGIHIYENPIGVLTNNPPFEYHLNNLTNYINLTCQEPDNRFSESFQLRPYSRGMGAIGLPGDLSSASRFVRAAFVKYNSVCDPNEISSVTQFFHILNAVSQPCGCNRTEDGLEKTIYSSCCNTNRGIYYYTTYENSQITSVDMHKCDLNGYKITSYPLIHENQICHEN